jgi:hypothetical protein
VDAKPAVVGIDVMASVREAIRRQDASTPSLLPIH